ncbi:MAG: class B sortase [Clostridia bacterium]|nr:class B sortase [Clostridia bacterium]
MEEQRIKNKSIKEIFLNILILLFIIILIISVGCIAKWFVDNKENEEISDKVSEAIIEINENKDEEIEYKVDFVKLKEINNQIVAYLKVNGTKIEYAVVQAKDNSYYLRKNLDKKYNVGGSIFMDYKNKLDGTDKNIVIYGHNMKNDSMFGTLKNILKEEWYNNEENYIINLTTEKEEKKYKVFSVYKIKTEDYYIDTEFKENEFEKFINTLKDRSIKDFGTEIDEQDNILTLSTCADNNAYRIVLHAKQIN